MKVAGSKWKRQEGGRARRKAMPRSQHGRWRLGKAGRSALEILHRSAVDRVPELLTLKYQRMAASPFGYFRGAVPVMAFDLGRAPHSGIVNQLCGDAHVRNLGAYAGPDGRLVFDMNDFDETICGPFEWDVKRLATSLWLAAREAGEAEADCRAAVRVFLRRYRKSVHRFAAMPVLELGRYQIHRHTELAALGDVFAKAERATPLHLRDVLTEEGTAAKRGKAAREANTAKKGTRKAIQAGEERRFRPEPPVLWRLAGREAKAVLEGLARYRESLEPERRHLLARYRAVDVAFKVVGTGSVGLRAYCLYLEGNGPNDPLFLQVKQEVASAWAPYLPAEAVTGDAREQQGRRVVEGQRAMQVQSDPFLGYTRFGRHDFLVRQLNDHKRSVNLGTLDGEDLLHYADLCGELLARGHGRSGDPDALAGYLGHGNAFDKAIAAFARRYADQTERDWKELRRSQ